MVTIILATDMLGQLIGGAATDTSGKRFGPPQGRVLRLPSQASPICVAPPSNPSGAAWSAASSCH
ncbi:MAG: hypothetical protein GY826_03670 [Fuerstiella sp.]|nr:hypothetical protein [Fuerstiella sp.]